MATGETSSSTSADRVRPTALRALFIYLAFVGGPAAGLIGILQIGRQLRPPMSVSGRWLVTAPSSFAEAARCLGLPTGDAAPVLVVTQSGPQLAMKLGEAGGTSFDARLDGNKLRGVVRRTAPAGAPGNGAGTVALEASVERTVEPPRMTGELRVRTGASCDPVPFTAERAPAGKA